MDLIVSTGTLPEGAQAYRRIVGDHTDEPPDYLKDSGQRAKTGILEI